MKSSKVGIVAVAILLVVAGFDFGIAQAGGIYSEQPVLSFEEMEALDQGSSSSSQEVPQWANLSAEETQMQDPIETGSLPNEELHGTEFPFPVGFVPHRNEDPDPFSRSGP